MKYLCNHSAYLFILVMWANPSLAIRGSEKGLNNSMQFGKNLLNARLRDKAFHTAHEDFFENKGQLRGYDGLPHNEVKFVFDQSNLQIFLLEKGIAYQFTKVHYPEGYQNVVGGKGPFRKIEKPKEIREKVRIETYRIDMSLVDANPNSDITFEGKSEDYANFFNRNAFDVRHYSKIIYHDIYPDIDWVICSKYGEIKYDFVVRPGADPSRIKMAFKHQENLKLNEDGSFTLWTPMGSVTERKPISFQGENKIETRFIIVNDTISFALNAYNKIEPLLIDPNVIWATYQGDTGDDYGFSCNTDASGNIYLAGQTSSASNIATGGYQNTYGGGLYDAFLTKFNANGQRLWTTYYGGSGDDIGRSCAIDGSGNIYLAGETTSSLNISHNGHQSNYGGAVDAFIVKFNSSGTRQWATYYGGPGNDFGYSCASNATGDVYLCGTTSSTINIALMGHQNSFGGGNSDAFLVKFDGAGVRLWATYYGDLSYDEGYSCAVDIFGSVYLCGHTISSSNIIASGGYQNISGGGIDAFLAKFNTNGMRIWSTYYGGSSFDQGFSCTVDGSGNVYLAGYTNSYSNIASNGHQNSNNGSGDGFLVKFDSGGTRIWATYYGGVNYGDPSTACSTDGSGNVYLSGFTASSSFIAYNGYQNTYGGGNMDAYIVKFNGNGVRLWGTYYGDTGEDRGYSCAISQSGAVYLAGGTSSSASLASMGFQSNYGGGPWDAFLVKFCPDPSPSQPSAIVGNSIVCLSSSQVYSVSFDPSSNGYVWNLPAGWSGASNTNTIMTVPMTNGSLSVSASGTCGSSQQQTMSVSVLSTSISVNSGSICSGQNFSILVSGASTYTYSGGGSVVSPTTSTSYSITGTNSLGCISTNAAICNVSVFPVPLITVNSGSICSGQSFTIVPSGANSYTYSGGSSVVNPSTNTNYTVMGTSLAGCISNSPGTSSVMVNIVPTLTLSASKNPICIGESLTLTVSGAGSYTWVQGGNDTTIIVSPAISTTYTVFGRDKPGCEDSISYSLMVDNCVGWLETEKYFKVGIYPNPSTGQFVLEIHDINEKDYIIFSTLGERLIEAPVNDVREKLDISALPKGIYLLVIRQNNRILSSTKIIKE